MAKIGVLTCSNCTRDLGCSSFFCLSNVYQGNGQFARWKDRGGAQLAGIISCAGCPTTVASERLLGRVRSLTELGVEGIHLSSCMKVLCPFAKKYANLLEDRFPDVEIIMGTHDDEPAVEEMFKTAAKDMLCQPQRSMADLISLAPQA